MKWILAIVSVFLFSCDNVQIDDDVVDVVDNPTECDSDFPFFVEPLDVTYTGVN